MKSKQSKTASAHKRRLHGVVKLGVELAKPTQIAREHLKNAREELDKAWSSGALSWAQERRVITASAIIGDIWWKLYEGSTA